MSIHVRYDEFRAMEKDFQIFSDHQSITSTARATADSYSKESINVYSDIDGNKFFVRTHDSYFNLNGERYDWHEVEILDDYDIQSLYADLIARAPFDYQASLSLEDLIPAMFDEMMDFDYAYSHMYDIIDWCWPEPMPMPIEPGFPWPCPILPIEPMPVLPVEPTDSIDEPIPAFDNDFISCEG
jgi:hypothetical protein